jgi:hypothetical protein
MRDGGRCAVPTAVAVMRGWGDPWCLWRGSVIGSLARHLQLAVCKEASC